MNEDPLPMLMRRHFEYGLTLCVKSVHDVDLQRYENFKAKYDPNFSFDKKGDEQIKLNGLMKIKKLIERIIIKTMI